MVNELGRLFGILPRQAENADARMELRHHDPDRQRQRRDQDEDESSDKVWADDNAVVSVAALEVFLKNLLQSPMNRQEQRESRAQKAGDENTGWLDFGNHPTEHPLVAGETPMTRAAQAYQTTAEKQKPAGTPPNAASAAEDARQEPLPLDLAAHDVRLMHQILDKLKILRAQGIDYVTIERGDSFLQSLADAVDKALVAQ